MIAASPDTMTTLDEIIDNFSLLEEWDDRYRYVIELGRGLNPLSEQGRTEMNKVQGCASQVWLATTVHPNGPGGPVLTFSGDSDAHIVRGSLPSCSRCFPVAPPARSFRRRDRLVRAPGPARTLDAATLEWVPFDGRAHTHGRPRGACARGLKTRKPGRARRLPCELVASAIFLLRRGTAGICLSSIWWPQSTPKGVKEAASSLSD